MHSLRESCRFYFLGAAPRSCNLYELPPEIGGCQHLETLSLIGNSLSAIPAEVGMLTELRYLYLRLSPYSLRHIPRSFGTRWVKCSKVVLVAIIISLTSWFVVLYYF